MVAGSSPARGAIPFMNEDMMTLDNADLALIEIDPNATLRELALVAEVRRLRKVKNRDGDSAIAALEDCQAEAKKARDNLSRAHLHLDGKATNEVYDALADVDRSLSRIEWR